MRSTVPRPRRAALATVAVAAAATMAMTGVLPASALPVSSGGAVATDVALPPADWPEFGYQGIVTDKSTMDYPAYEYIFPSVFHAGEHLADPLAEWYLYTAPHEDPGGIVLMYSNSLEGPWTEHSGNPLIANEWPPHYDHVPHVSSPDAFWNAEEGKLFMYFHGNNSVTRYATSDDGITFEYGGEAVTNAMGDVEGQAKVTESSYARVFDHPDPDSEYNYAMFYMANDNTPVPGGLTGIRRIRLAESVDARTWIVDPVPVVEPGEEEGANVSAANLWEHDGQLYVIYHASSGKSYARTIDDTLRNVGDTPIVLHEASGLGTDVGRVASPEVVTDGDETYLFYESGDRLGGTIAWAKDGAETVIEPAFGGFPTDAENPVFDTCAAAGTDEFDDGLGDVWERTIREDLARHTVADGTLTIPTYAGGVAAAPLLQQSLPDGAWQITTKVTLDPANNYQQAGLLLYAGDDDYLKLDLGKAKPGRVVELVSAGTPSFTTQQRYDGSEVWLRLTSDGKQIEASRSSDGVDFEQIGSRLSAEADSGEPRFTHVGPFAFRGGAAVAEIDATFHWFRFSPSASEYEECMNPGVPELSASVAQAEIDRGEQQTVDASGFVADEQVTGVMNSDPVDLGTRAADGDGSVAFTWTISQDTEPGVHTVTLTGAESGEVSVQFRVLADAGDGDDGGSDAGGDGGSDAGDDGASADGGGAGDAGGSGDLAATGGSPGLVWAAALALLIAGGAAVLIARRRRHI